MQKLPDFQKFRDTTGWFQYLINIRSVVVFLYSCVMIIADPYYFFGMNLTNLTCGKRPSCSISRHL